MISNIQLSKIKTYDLFWLYNAHTPFLWCTVWMSTMILERMPSLFLCPKYTTSGRTCLVNFLSCQLVHSFFLKFSVTQLSVISLLSHLIHEIYQFFSQLSSKSSSFKRPAPSHPLNTRVYYSSCTNGGNFSRCLAFIYYDLALSWHLYWL